MQLDRKNKMLVKTDILKYSIESQANRLREKCDTGLLNQEFNSEFEKSVNLIWLKTHVSKIQICNMLGIIFNRGK
jgi:hypothetical protein